MPAILGFAAVIKNLSGVADAEGVPAVMASVVASQLIVSMFLIGGVLDRLARDRSVGAGAFFSACGVYFVRFFRLGIIAAVVYWLLFVWFHTWLFDAVYPRLTANLTVERTAFFYRVVLYAIFAVPVVFANLVFDYAKVRAVVEDRRSMIGAVSAGVRFVLRNPATLGLYALNTLLFLLVIASLLPGRAGRKQQPAGVRDRPALHRAQSRREAAVRGVADGAVPGPSRACGLCGAAGAEVAGFAGRRSHRARAVDSCQLPVTLPKAVRLRKPVQLRTGQLTTGRN